jgi:lipopolysaccharide assembly outer membrane protein LptD (OstA)
MTTLLLSLACSHAAHADTVVSTDWKIWEELPESEKSRIAPYCPGGFIAIPVNNPEQGQTRLRFNSATINDNQVIEAQGDVSIESEGINTHSDQATYSEVSQESQLTGNVVVRTTDAALSADSADISLETYYALLKQAQFVLADQDMHGSADQLERTEQQTLIGKNVRFTRCAPDSKAWQIRASTLIINNKTQIAYVWNPRVEIAQIPTPLYFPYLSFPLNNQARTGFLVPTFGNGYLQEYYIHLAPNYDDTLALEYNRTSGWLLHNEFRFLTNNHNGISDVSTTLSNTNDNSDETADDSPVESEQDARWSISHKQSGLLFPAIGYDLSTRWVSDTEYDLDNTSGVNDEIDTQKANLALNAAPWGSKVTLGLNYTQPVSDSTTKFETLNTTASLKKNQWSLAYLYERQYEFDAENNPASASNYDLLAVPNISLTVKPSKLPFGINLTETLRYTEYSRELPDSVQHALAETDYSIANQTNRLHTSLNVNKKWQTSWGYFQPSVEGFATQYRYENPMGLDVSEQETVHLAWRASLDQGLTLKTETDQFSHSLAPRVYFAYSPLTEQDAPQLDTETGNAFDLFTASRFKGIDRVGDMKRLSTSLNYSIADKTDNRNIFSAGISKGIKLEQERLTLTSVSDIDPDWQPEYSDWNLSSSYHPTLQWSFNGKTSLDHDTYDANSLSLNAKYQPSNRVFVDFEMTKADELDTVHFGAYYPIFQNVALIGFIETQAAVNDTTFNWTEQEPTELLVGVDIDSCCWNVRLAVLETAASEDEDGNSIFLDNSNYEIKAEFTLKGIGVGAGNIEDTLNNLDFGYSGNLFNYR